MDDLSQRVQAAVGDRYRVERELGRGGMATVFLVEDRKHTRLVALKILHPEIAAALGPDRFRREIEFAAHLNHPHILTLLDSGESDGLLWYAMPFVEGESLRDQLRRERTLPVAEVVDLARQVASALDYAHSQGILHRDIKPENILLAHGHAWVADFGIARILRSAGGEHTTSALIFGTPAYMSPEQAAGEELDGRSDLYALGAVVYEALAGTPPLSGMTPAGSAGRRSRSTVTPLRASVGVTPGVEAAVRRALALDPAERQSTAGVFVQEMEGAVTSPQVRQAARRASIRTLAAGAVALSVAAAVWWARTRPPEFDDFRLVLLPVEGPAAAIAGWGPDLSVALETNLNSTRVLVAKDITAELGLPPGAGIPDSTVPRLASARRARYTLSLQASNGTGLVVVLWDHVKHVRDQRPFGAPKPGQVFRLSEQIAGELLPTLIPTGGRIDQSALGRRSVEALAAFLQGERAYRLGQFALADTQFSLAVKFDSGFTWAALRGAQAASWNRKHDRALRLILRALPGSDSLGPRYVAFARGLEDYQQGRADSALDHLREAVRLDSLWAEAHMALAEVYHHYLPQEGAPLDSAEVHFSAARRFDPSFAPPLLHLIQLAVWKGNRAAADSLLKWFDRGDKSETSEITQARLMVRCLHDPDDISGWGEALRNPNSLDPAAQAALWLAVGGLERADCAEAGIRKIPTDQRVAGAYAVYADAILAHVLAARGDSVGLDRVLRSSAALTLPFQNYLRIAARIAGVPISTDLVAAAVDTLRARVGTASDSVPIRRIQNRWLLGTWEVHQGKLTAATAWLDSLRALPRDSAVDAARQGFTASLSARLTLAQGDTAAALEMLERLTPYEKQDQLRWTPWQAFAHERMLRVRIHQAQDRAERALEVAKGFDSPASYGLLLYLPESLERRARLAETLDEVEYRRSLGARLAALQRTVPGGTP